MEDFSLTVTDSPPEWSLCGRPKSKKHCFYIIANTKSWPHESAKTLCKFGVTGKDVEDRLDHHEDFLRNRGIKADLEICFKATGEFACEELENSVRAQTLAWIPEGFGRSSEWRHCLPRQLARIAVYLYEEQILRPPDGLGGAPYTCAQGEGADGSLFHDDPTSSSLEGREEAVRKLCVHGSQIRREPVLALDLSPVGEREESEEAMRKGRPLREPRPELGPDGTGFWEGRVPTSLGLSHRALRQRNLFAEWRTRQGENEESVQLSVRTSEAQSTLLDEARACSPYGTRSAYLRAAGTGRDRSAPIVARAGVLFGWTYRHLGDEIGPEAWEELRRLLRFLFGTKEIEAALQLSRRHLLAQQLSSLNGSVREKDLPSVPAMIAERTQRMSNSEESFSGCTMSVRLSPDQKRLIRENHCHSDYPNMSDCLRHLALGWDRSCSVAAQCKTIAQWAAEHQGNLVGYPQWYRLENMLQEDSDVFLFGADKEKDVDGILRQGAEHLLGADLETISKETGIPL
jgi:hypothetical protein